MNWNPGSGLLPVLVLLLGTGLLICLVLLDRRRRQLLRFSILEEQAHREQQNLSRTIDELRRDNARLQRENSELGAKVASLTTELIQTRKQAQAHQDLLEAAKKQLQQEFQLLADRIFTEKGSQLTSLHQRELTSLLTPVRQQLDIFRQKIEDVYERESRDRISLTAAVEQLRHLNERLSQDAVNLTRALKGQSKAQGQWGEMILERLLEESGLRPGHEFDTQVSLTGESGRRQLPDVILHLPGSRDIIIDAKVSLTAYERYASADSPAQAAPHLKDHLASVKKHISSLSAKKYQQIEGIRTLDFVILFIPVEGAFQAAVASDPGLLTGAMRRNIMLASPSTLLALLRTIHHMWRVEEQHRNGLLIAKQAGNLYDKFVGFVTAFEEIGLRLEQTRQSWELARKRLTSGRGNLVQRTEALRDLGVQPARKLPDELIRESNADPGKPPVRE
ncbi:DNA recombination protein RmuC [Desulfolithobacter dissulfuricans]|uniref:DNA recombination protein RmuC n=1 Tax=Desulfolithobacter dissulfuricans TaxID=2795293 RepID=UPI002279716E|nr:DNA recombination protein RmuC [Desulfolithobacter dissulfuricans]